MDKGLTRIEILKKIRLREISAEQGLELIKGLKGLSVPDDLFYYTSQWIPQNITIDDSGLRNKKVLLFADNENTGQTFSAAISNNYSCTVTIAIPGESLNEFESGLISINPGSQEDYNGLLNLLKQQGKEPDVVIHNWSLMSFSDSASAVEEQLGRSFFSLFMLSKGIMQAKIRSRINILYFYNALSDIHDQPLFAATAGFLKTIQQENPKITGKAIGLDSVALADSARIAAAELSDVSDTQVYYKGLKRYVNRFSEVVPVGTPPLKSGGTYLITGGLGGLGLMFAEYIASQVKANLVLTGRSHPVGSKQEALNRLNRKGANAVYRQSDITQEAATQQLIEAIKKEFGSLNGIIHSAGVAMDDFVIKKEAQQTAAVISPKVQGTLNIDRFTASEDLDFFIFFSSISAALGNPGQSDYAFANSFLDNYAFYRDTLVKKGIRKGKTISINWPLWAEGGMQINETGREFLFKNWGMVPLQTQKGIQAFAKILGSGFSRVGTAEGNKAKLRERFKIIEVSASEQSPATQIKASTGGADDAKKKLLKICAGLLKVNMNDIDEETDLLEYGVDSMMMIQVMNKIEQEFGDTVEPNIISEYPTIRQLADYLIESGIAGSGEVKKEEAPVYTTPVSQSPTLTAEIKTAGENQDKVQDQLLDICSELLKVGKGDIDIETDLLEYGVDSMMMIQVMNKIEKVFGDTVEPNVISEYPTIQGLAGYLIEEGIVGESGQAAPQTFETQAPPSNRKIYQPSKTATDSTTSRENSLTNVEDKLLDICAELLKVAKGDIDIETDLLEYGVDSMMMIQVMNKIEKVFGDTVEPNVISEYPTIQGLAGYLIEEGIAGEGGPAAPQTFETQAPQSSRKIYQPAKTSADSTSVSEDLSSDVEDKLLDICAELLKVNKNDIDIETNLMEYGVDSMMMISVLNKIEQVFGDTVEPNALAEYPTISLLAQHLIGSGVAKASEKPIIKQPVQTKPIETIKPVVTPVKKSFQTGRFFNQPQSQPENESVTSAASAPSDKKNKVAIISMACRFPQASSVESFWQNLKNGKNCITETPPERWDVNKYYSPDKNAPGRSYSKWAGYIDNIELFDAAFFGIKDQDAVSLDPQHRILLELTQELFDKAGYTKKELDNSRTSVYLGGNEGSYVYRYWDQMPDEYLKKIVVNRIQNMMAARISDFYNLRGASLVIDTACSSSLVALHEACRNILDGESDMAVVGGVDLIIGEYNHIGFSKSGALSKEPKSYVFDERAGGFVLGEGSGLIMLKDYQKAMADGDNIIGLVIGSAVNNDGHTMGLTVPDLNGQKEVVTQAVKKSKVSPETITFYEAHGTGTLLGDPIEVKAATTVYRKYTDKKQYCAIGSVKSNIGHLLRAAGISGVLKILTSMQNKMIPPTLNCEKPHPRFKFEQSPFFPNLSLRDWNPPGGIRRGAISSFGFGGTNAHCIFEEFDQAAREYSPKRTPLPPTQFKKKRFWIGKPVVAVTGNKPVSEETKYRELLERLSRGEISVNEMKKMGF